MGGRDRRDRDMRSRQSRRVVEAVADHQRTADGAFERLQPRDLVGWLQPRLVAHDAELARDERDRWLAIARQDLDLMALGDFGDDGPGVGPQALPDGEDGRALWHPKDDQRRVRPGGGDRRRLRLGSAPGDRAEFETFAPPNGGDALAGELLGGYRLFRPRRLDDRLRQRMSARERERACEPKVVRRDVGG